MKLAGILVEVATAGALIACTMGADFMRPPTDFVHLGKTTRAQVVERFGKPERESRIHVDERQLSILGYYFISELEAPKIRGTVCRRTLVFLVSREIVVGESFISSCASDHTDFDEHKAQQIVKGTTRCEDVVTNMGRANVWGIYPAAPANGELELGYVFEYESAAQARLEVKTLKESFLIYCDPRGVVRDTSLTIKAVTS